MKIKLTSTSNQIHFTNKLKVFPTSRAIRTEIKKEKNNSLLPSYLTIDELFKKSIIIKGKKYCDEEQRFLFLKEAVNINNIEALGLSKEFSVFLKQSDYIFRFFGELSSELIEINSLQTKDTYEFYYEHLQLLEIVYKNYIDLLEKNSYVDKINLPQNYELNFDLINKFGEIEFFLEGYFTKFEAKVIEKISNITTVMINLSSNEYNQKTKEFLKDFVFKNGFDYKVNLSTKKVMCEKISINNNQNIDFCAFDTRINQLAYIKKSITTMISSGLEASNIAVVLPDESYVQTMQLFDNEKYFNYAMGLNIKESLLFKKTDAIFDYFTSNDNKAKEKIKYLEIDSVFLDCEFGEVWYENITTSKFEQIVLYLKQNETNEEICEKYDEIVYRLYKLFFSQKQELNLKDVFKIILQKIYEITLDDANSGKITVLGLLETRYVNFDGLIIVDFNETFIPKASVKDKFLSSKIKVLANLPTHQDRKNLQKYYYKKLLDGATQVYISFVSNENSKISRFANELFSKVKIDYKTKDEEFKHILYNTYKINHFKDEIIMDIDLSKKVWSATSLKNYLECRRKYYYNYLLKIKEHELSLKPKGYELGDIIHKVLEEFYKSRVEITYENLMRIFNKYKSQNSFLTLDLEIWREKLKQFIILEQKSFLDKRTVVALEEAFTINVDEITINGVIDRIDTSNGFYEVIDYKTSNSLKVDTKNTFLNSKDFQLEFYYLAMKKLYNEENRIKVYYYDLAKMKKIEEVMLDEKLVLLYSKLELLKTKTVNFTKCEERQTCIYCNYKTICDR